MAEMVKFLFDTVFDTQEVALQAAPPRPEKTYWSTDELNAAKNQSFERGKQAGMDETTAAVSAQTAAALEKIATNVSALTSQLQSQRERLKSEGIVLANIIARSLAAALIAREPLHEIENLFGEALEFLPGTPHIVVRLNESLLEPAKEKLEAIAAEKGFQGKLILLAQSDIGEGDCRIEWAQGGVVKDQQMVLKKMRQITARHMDAALMPSEEKFSGFDRTAFLAEGEDQNSSGRENQPHHVETAGPPEEI